MTKKALYSSVDLLEDAIRPVFTEATEKAVEPDREHRHTLSKERADVKRSIGASA